MALRGAVDFRTPQGWDTVFTGLLNQPQAPALFALTARVETDWYAFDTEFRYVLQVGDVLSGSGRTPVGQAFVVPRVRTDLREAEDHEVEAFRSSQREFAGMPGKRQPTWQDCIWLGLAVAATLAYIVIVIVEAAAVRRSHRWPSWDVWALRWGRKGAAAQTATRERRCASFMVGVDAEPRF